LLWYWGADINSYYPVHNYHPGCSLLPEWDVGCSSVKKGPDMRPNSDPTCRVHVLAVSPLESDHTSLAHIFGRTAWDFDIARSIEEASEKLSTSPIPVILCEENLPDGTWKDLLALTERQASPCYVVVTSQSADDRLWAEVLNLGAYDVLAKPFDSKEVFRVIGLAWRHWLDLRKPVGRAHGKTVTATAVA
jgi:DNA-binding NtrC family response regulator